MKSSGPLTVRDAADIATFDETRNGTALRVVIGGLMENAK